MSRFEGITRLLIANRGEIAVRIAQTAKELGIETVAIAPEDDAAALHARVMDQCVRLDGQGPAAYLDIEQVIGAAREAGCEAIHPGYGFLAENAVFAQRCEDAGITFVGPTVSQLQLFGDKMDARGAAENAAVPVLPASPILDATADAEAFLASLDGRGMMIKAVAGGGGRGMRQVRAAADIESALAAARREAGAAFGDDRVYGEALVERALHIEVQVIGDGRGGVTHLGERECSIQRRHQKVVEIAPSPQLPAALRNRICEAAVNLAALADYRSLGTFEFLVDGESLQGDDAAWFFIEANPRIQVEHTVTEEIFDVDLVEAQLRLAAGASLESLALPARPNGSAIQLRVNMEKLVGGEVVPASGLIDEFELPGGRGVRVDTQGYAGYRTSAMYDSLLAKVIVRAAGFDEAVAKAQRALGQFRVHGVATNLPVLQNLLEIDEFARGEIDTRFFERWNETLTRPRDSASRDAADAAAVDQSDPLAVLNYGRDETMRTATPPVDAEPGAITAAMHSTIVSVSVAEGDQVQRGQELILLNAMKMEHVVEAPHAGIVSRIDVGAGATVPEGAVLLVLDETDVEGDEAIASVDVDLESIRDDLAEVNRRRALTSDESRTRQVEKRHARGGRTAKENVEDLCDEGSFLQFGSLAVGAGLTGTVDELLDYAPSDGLVMGLGHVNGDRFDETRSRVAAVAYDYTVLAGTQGGMNHKMIDRMFQVAQKLELPLVLFSEGGGGRAGGGSRNAPGGQVLSGGGGLNTPSWMMLGHLSGRVPIIGINSGLCFAGNAALLGMCDVIIATENSSIGMGGPAMIEGGGLGIYRPEEVGPMSVQVPNGVVDIAVKDEAEAVAAAKQYLSYFQGPIDEFECADQRLLRHAIPENRLRVYDIRSLIETMADTGSMLELRRGFGKAMLTAFIRLDGRPVGVIANDPSHLSGAIDADAADKAARFMTLCDAFDIPLLFLCDTPGIMVGPDAEREATVRHAARMFVTGASISVPSFMVILRKSYGLGAQAMAGGCQRMPGFVVGWPTSEFGGMGLEGQVKLGQRARLEAIEDPQERQAEFERLVAKSYERGKGLNAAHVYEIEDIIDPADTRRWVVGGLKASPPPLPRREKKRPCIDTW